LTGFTTAVLLMKGALTGNGSPLGWRVVNRLKEVALEGVDLLVECRRTPCHCSLARSPMLLGLQ
jgi:hypothetical protein